MKCQKKKRSKSVCIIFPYEKKHVYKEAKSVHITPPNNLRHLVNEENKKNQTSFNSRLWI